MVRPSGPVRDDAELARLRTRDPDTGDGHSGAACDVLLDHLARIHAVDVVGAEDDDVVGVLVVDEVQRLEDRVGGAGEPARAEPLLGGHRGHVVAESRSKAARWW